MLLLFLKRKRLNVWGNMLLVSNFFGVKRTPLPLPSIPRSSLKIPRSEGKLTTTASKAKAHWKLIAKQTLKPSFFSENSSAL